jgi:indolepyruvate decarboxylase
VILVDVEIRRYNLEQRVTALARKLGIPVVTTFMGRGLLEDAPTSARHISRRRR